MLQLFASPEFKALSLKNANNRSNQKVIACTGPTPFAQTEYDMIDEETGKLPPASEVWMAQHSTLNANNERKWVDSSSENYYHEIRITEEEVMPVDETVNDNEDVLRVVFGARSGYVRGKGTGYKSTTKGMNTNNQNGKIEQLEAQVGDLTARLAYQAKHNLALTQRFEKFMEMVENERHESSSRSGHMEDALTPEETNGEDYTRDECSNKARRAEKKRSAPCKQVSNSRKKNRELREE
ncbi:unnamed protein product [Linum tenue]|uniref:Uncharacterized protein n=2 Tax=Linum tenue TaxID=586396 RepID=A0AAV0LFS3_9ROSI|nr:unnamed protein product [Linum tenue]